MINKIYQEFLNVWNQSTEQALKDFIEVQALSPDFDHEWQKTGLLQKALEQADAWLKKQDIKGLKTEIIQAEGFTPCLLVEVAAFGGKPCKETVFMYGHLDKQPPNIGWDADKNPWKAVIQEGKLYGRGGADDGYSFYCQLSAIKALQNLGLPHPRCVGLFETAEESGSQHYPEYVKELKQRIGKVGFIVAFDSNCGDYERLWITKSLRGMLGGVLEVKVLENGMHSGDASGVVPCSFLIARRLLERVEDSSTGTVKGAVFHAKISKDLHKDCHKIAKVMGKKFFDAYPWAGSTRPLHKTVEESIIHRNWYPELSISGADGLPSVEEAGNVLRPFTRLKIGIRLPPTVNAPKASAALEKILTSKPPYGAQVSYTPTVQSDGWTAGKVAPWLDKVFSKVSKELWKKDFCYQGMGGSIPLLNSLAAEWPRAQFMVAGTLGPKSNAHGPNEFLHIDYAQKLATSFAYIITSLVPGKREK